jgi:hypothetical protein
MIMESKIEKELRRLCSSFGYEIVAIASGFACIQNDKGQVIITLPRNMRFAGALAESMVHRTNGNVYRGYLSKGRFSAQWPECVIDELKKLASPSQTMSWEEYLLKYNTNN